MAELKQVVSQIPGPSDTMGKDSASEIPCPSATMGKSSQCLCPAATKKKGKGKVEESVVPPTVRRSPRQGRKEIETETDDMMDFLKNLSQSSTYGEPSSKKEEMSTQEYLQDAMGNLSQVSHVKGFDPSQKTSDEESPKWVTPLSSLKPGDWRTPTLKDMKLPEDRVNDDDYSYLTLLLKSIVGTKWRWRASNTSPTRKKEQHLFKWIDEALLDEIQRMHEQQSRMAEEIEDLRSSLKKTVEEAVIEHKKSGDVGLIGSILTILCLWIKS
ncbi:hypothetical protein Bca52824_040177 [Brassica carinata]|uniref:Uncharacterized protein n=1 Tax=Brassica carinata TaxID=52824 RepID=A0A8X7RUD2_BRACI|nr:hypothetical protein Bca52824_040177 [Brassica carinata]